MVGPFVRNGRKAVASCDFLPEVHVFCSLRPSSLGLESAACGQAVPQSALLKANCVPVCHPRFADTFSKGPVHMEKVCLGPVNAAQIEIARLLEFLWRSLALTMYHHCTTQLRRLSV